MNKKSSLISIFSIMILSMITKIISMSSRIIMSRELGLEAISIYSLVNPLFVFFITITSFSLPTTISTLVSKNPKKAKNILLSSLIIAFIINLIFIILITLFSNFIAEKLLNNISTLYSIRLLTIVVPLTTFSSIIKGYYMGKKELILASESSLIEECARILSVIFLVGFFQNFTSDIKATFFLLVMIIGEIIQTSYLLLSSGNQALKKIPKIWDFSSIERENIKNVLSISTPLTLSRIVTSFTFMIEPILLTNLLIKQGLEINKITIDYGVLSSYVMPLLLLPGFFSLSISNYLLPNLSSLISQKEYNKSKKLFNKTILLSLFIGLFFSLIFFFFGDKIIQIIYQVDYGKKEIKLLSIPFIIYYIEAPVNVSMHAINQSKIAFKSSLLSSFVRLSLLIFLVKYFNVFAVSIATLSSCYLDVIINYLIIQSFFKRNNKKSIN